MIHTLRPYQQKIEDSVRQAFMDGFRAPVVSAPTGAGKTHIFTSIATKAASKGNSTMIVVHRSYLIKQVSDKLRDIRCNHGIIAPGHTMTRDKIQIASVDTLVRRFERIRKPGLIIFDEGHHVLENNKWGKVVKYCDESLVLGVTATPCRTNGQGLGKIAGGIYDKLIPGPSILDLTPEYMTPYKLYAPDNIDLSGVRSIAGDFDKKEVVKRMKTRKIYGNVPGHYKKLCYGIPAIAFCVNVKETENVAQEFNNAGIPSAAVCGKTPEYRRRALFDGLARGKYLVLCSCDLVSEGFDVPVCGCAISLRPTQSLTLCLQQWGRAGRLYPGKKYAYILDHVGNHLRHGFPDQDRVWSLEGSPTKKNSSSTPGIKRCPMCFNIHRPSPICPECGYKYLMANKKVEIVDCQLKEIKTPGQLKVEKALEIKKMRAKARSLEELQELAKVLGYKSGWAKHVYSSRQKKGIV